MRWEEGILYKKLASCKYLFSIFEQAVICGFLHIYQKNYLKESFPFFIESKLMPAQSAFTCSNLTCSQWTIKNYTRKNLITTANFGHCSGGFIVDSEEIMTAGVCWISKITVIDISSCNRAQYSFQNRVSYLRIMGWTNTTLVCLSFMLVATQLAASYW